MMMFETLKIEPRYCKEHGKYVATLIDYGVLGKIWTPCDGCEAADNASRSKQAAEEHLQMMRQHKQKILIDRSGVPAKFMGKSFDNYLPTCGNGAERKAEVMQYAELIGSKNPPVKSLIMLGKIGSGKTHLACAIIDHVVKESMRPCQYVTFSDVVRRVKSSWRNGSVESETDVYNKLSEPYLLVVDEVGVQGFTDFERTVAYEVINARYLANLPTVVVSNLAVSGLVDALGERVSDRLREGGGRALVFDWASYRSTGGGA